ncbi:MAG: signal peptide peptidase SppA [Bacteroidetes bacterium]|nr:signal peptide peptidase SppA [Bacteroidota bacterium]
MKNFLVYTLATITGIIIASFLFFLILFGSISAMMSAGDKKVSVSDNSVLVLKTNVQIPDRSDNNPLAGLDIVNMTISPVTGLNEILRNIDKAADDPKIKGILIDNGMMPSGWATTEEIRNSLRKFSEESGKFIIAYSDYALDQQGYYLSSIADKIFINPSSSVDFKGLTGEVMFYKKALEKLGLEVQVIRHGKFKGAVEPYILDKLSEENKAQIKDYVGSIWNHSVRMMAESRGLSETRLNELADKLAGTVSSDALENGLVDGLLFRDELNDTLKILSGLTTDDKINFVTMGKYAKVPDPDKVLTLKRRIAVIYASGSIVTGRGSETNIGGNNYSEIIRKERLDSTVKAIVLRVNSLGGSAIASDMIWRELELAAREKPVVISMGNYAASGGYYISAPGTKIYANPTTISGSIGVFGLIPNAGKLMEQKIGITTESVNTNEHSDFPSVFRPMSTYERQIMQKNIEQVYSDFVNKVSAGRDMDFTSVDSIGQGRVWSGASALNIGLVDEMGGLNDAIEGAAELAGIENYSIKELPVAEDPYTKLLKQISGDVRINLLKKELGEAFRFYNELKETNTLSGIQARLPYFIDIY